MTNKINIPFTESLFTINKHEHGFTPLRVEIHVNKSHGSEKEAEALKQQIISAYEIVERLEQRLDELQKAGFETNGINSWVEHTIGELQKILNGDKQ